MKNKHWKKGIATLALAGVLSGFAGVGSIVANAALQVNDIGTDDFNNTEIENGYDAEIWNTYTTEDASQVFDVQKLSEPHTVLRVGATNANEEEQGLISTKKFTNLREITFDMYYASNEWCSLQFPAEAPTGKMPCYSFPAGRFSASTYKGYEWVSVKIKAYSNTYAKMFVVSRGEEWPDEENPTKEIEGMDLSSCYFSMYFKVSRDKSRYFLLDNFKFTEEDGTVTEETFEDAEDTLSTQIHTITAPGYTADHRIDHEGGQTALVMTGAKNGDRLISKTELVKNIENLSNNASVVDASYEVTLANDVDKLGYVFGMATVDGDPFKSSYIVETSAVGAALAQYNAEGVRTELASVAYDSIAGAITPVAVDVLRSGKFVATIGENTLEYDVGLDVWFGYTGFVVVGDATGNIVLDSASIVGRQFNMPVSKSVSTNFSNEFNIKKYGAEDAKGAEFLYVGDGVTVADGEMTWTKALDEGFFGANYAYDEFICEFKLTAIFFNPADLSGESSMQCSKWLGFDFGKKNHYKEATSYGSNAIIRVDLTPYSDDPSVMPEKEWERANVTLGVKKDGASANAVGTKNETLSAQFFKDIWYDGVTVKREDVKAEDAVCFRFVAKGDTVEMYVKKASDGEYVKYFTVTGAKVSGYASICCTGKGFMSFDDYSVTNTAEIYEIPDTYVPDANNKEEVYVYDRGHVDVNWEDEIKLNASNDTTNSGGSSLGGCMGSVSVGGIGLLTLFGCVVAVIRRKKD